MRESADEVDWDEWVAMTEAQQDREMVSAVNQYNEMIDRMSRAEYAAYRRREALELCRSIRKNLRAFPGISIFEESLRRTQRRLLVLRMERAGMHVSRGLN